MLEGMLPRKFFENLGSQKPHFLHFETLFRQITTLFYSSFLSYMHHFDGIIPGLGVICGLSLLLALVPAQRTLHKNQHFQIPIRPGNSGEKSHPVDTTEIPILFLFYVST